jgi:hypothetical protein
LVYGVSLLAHLREVDHLANVVFLFNYIFDHISLRLLMKRNTFIKNYVSFWLIFGRTFQECKLAK